MLKLIWIGEKEIKGRTFKFLKRTSDSKLLNDVSGTEARDIILNEKPDFLFVNIKKSANADIMNMPGLCNFERLQISIFTFKPFKSRVINFLLPAEVLQILISGFLKTRHAVRR
jgi:hypothetical protein